MLDITRWHQYCSWLNHFSCFNLEALDHTTVPILDTMVCRCCNFCCNSHTYLQCTFMTYVFPLFGEMQLIKHVHCPRKLTAVEIWTKCLFSSQCGSCQERQASDLRSLRWNGGSPTPISDSLCLLHLLAMSGWLKAFFPLSIGCQMLSTHVYSSCHRMPYPPRWNISQLKKEEKKSALWQQL